MRARLWLITDGNLLDQLSVITLANLSAQPQRGFNIGFQSKGGRFAMANFVLGVSSGFNIGFPSKVGWFARFNSDSKNYDNWVLMVIFKRKDQ